VELGVLSFGDIGNDEAGARLSVSTVLERTLERIRLAEEVGLGFYGLGEHHLDTYAISSPGTVLAAASSVTSRIKLGSAVTVLSTEDPVRLYQQFTTLDQLSHGRAELLAGRGSFTESFPLFGADLKDYDELYDEKLDLLLQIDRGNPVTWAGKYRAPLDNSNIYPRPYGEHLRILVGTGGNAQSSARAGVLGLPVVYAVIGGEPERFAPLVQLYRQAGKAGGHDGDKLHVTMTGVGLIAEDARNARDTFYPYWNQVMEYGARARGWAVPGRADYDRYALGARALMTGDPDEVAERIITVGKLVGADRYGLQMDWAGVPHKTVMTAIELLGTRVRPQVEKEFPS